MDGMLIAIGMLIAFGQLLLIFLIWKDHKPVWKDQESLSNHPLNHRNRFGQNGTYYSRKPEPEEMQADFFKHDGRIGQGEPEARPTARNSEQKSFLDQGFFLCASRNGLNVSRTKHYSLKRLLVFSIQRR